MKAKLETSEDSVSRELFSISSVLSARPNVTNVYYGITFALHAKVSASLWIASLETDVFRSFTGCVIHKASTVADSIPVSKEFVTTAAVSYVHIVIVDT